MSPCPSSALARASNAAATAAFLELGWASLRTPAAGDPSATGFAFSVGLSRAIEPTVTALGATCFASARSRSSCSARARSCCSELRNEAESRSAVCLVCASFLARFGRQGGLGFEIAACGHEILFQPRRPVAPVLCGFAKRRRTVCGRLSEFGRLVFKFAGASLICIERAARHREALRKCVGPFALLLHRLPQLGSNCFPGPLRPRNFLGCLCRQCCLGFDVAPRRRKILLQPRGPLALLLQGFLQLRFAALACLFQPGRFLACFRRQCRLGLDVAPRRRKILLQPRGPLALLLQGLLQLRFAALACLFQPGRFLACFRRQCRLGLDIAPRRRKILLQPRGPLALLLQGLLQLRLAAPACLFQPGRFLACFRRQCRLGLDITPRRRKILLQPRGPLALLLQGLLQLRFAALACLFQPGRFLACFRRQCRLGLDIAPRRRKILLQPRGPLALLLQRLLQLRFAALACLFQPGRFLACFRRQCRLGLDIAPRRRQIPLQPRGPLTLLLQGLLTPPLLFSREVSSLAFVASAVWVSTSRRAAARSCSSRADRSRSCCRDFCSSASLLSLACFSREASSLAFVASAVWVSTSRRAAARSCSSRADRSRSCCKDLLRRAPLPHLFQPGRFLACFRRQCGLGLDFAPRRRKILLQPLGPIVLLHETLQQFDIAPCNRELK